MAGGACGGERVRDAQVDGGAEIANRELAVRVHEAGSGDRLERVIVAEAGVDRLGGDDGGVAARAARGSGVWVVAMVGSSRFRAVRTRRR
jgi:hypothetical protein